MNRWRALRLTRRPREALATLLLVAASVVSTLIGAELVARWLLPAPWYQREVGGGRGLGSPTSSRLGAQALRDRHYQVRSGLDVPAAKSARHRVLFLGDSFTSGSGVPDSSNVFVSRIEAILNQGSGTADTVWCFNGGIAGSLTHAWLNLFQSVEDVLDPELVVAVFFLRDGQTRTVTSEEIRKVRADLIQRDRSTSWRRFALFRRVADQLSHADPIGEEHLRTMAEGYFGGAADVEEWKNAQLNLLEIRKRAEARGARFSLVIFPVLFGLEREPYVLGDVVEEIQGFGRSFGIDTFSLLPAFEGKSDYSLWVAATDQHPNPDGHAIAAAALAPFIRDRLQPQPAPRSAIGELSPIALTRAHFRGLPPLEDAVAREALARLPVVRSSAELTALLGQLTAADPHATGRVSDLLYDPQTAPVALGALEELGPEALTEALLAILEVSRTNELIERWASWMIRDLGAKAVPGLLEGLRNPQAQFGAISVIALPLRPGDETFAPLLGEAVPDLVQLMLAGADARSAWNARIALGRIGEGSVPALAKLAEAAAPRHRRLALEALGYLGPRATHAAVELLERGTADPEDAVRLAAVRALWQVAPASAEASQILDRARQDPNAEVRVWAARTVAELDRLAGLRER